MKKIWCLLLLFLIAGCWHSPNSQFYMLSSQGLNSHSDRKLSVAVAKIKVPDLLDKPQMVVYDKKSDKVEILEFNRWAENFPDVLQAAVVNDLIAYLPEAYIKRSYLDNQNVNYNINIEINNLKAYKGDKVILTAWWNITNVNGRILTRRQETYETQVRGRSMQNLVDAQSQAVQLLSKDITEALLKL